MKNPLLKGSLNTLILKLLADNGQMYGYEIIRRIRESSLGEMEITEGALYPALHKLETEGLLNTERRQVSGRTRKYYSLSAKGRRASQDSLQQLRQFITSLENVLNPQKPQHGRS